MHTEHQKLECLRVVVSLSSADTEFHGFWLEPEKDEAPAFKRYWYQTELMITNKNSMQDLKVEVNPGLTLKAVAEGST